jgi:hypothetical protein
MTRVAGFETPKTTGMPLFVGYEKNIVQVCPAPSISRFGGSKIHIVVPSYDGYIYCFDSEGILVWKKQFDKPGEPFIGSSEVAIGDLSNDGIPEIVFTSYSTQENVSKLYILNTNGEVVQAVDIAGRGSMSAPTLEDIDSDGYVEIILSLKDVLGNGIGGVQVWKVASAKRNIIDWKTGRGNYLRTGDYRIE